jgi:hypothetical protein
MQMSSLKQSPRQLQLQLIPPAFLYACNIGQLVGGGGGHGGDSWERDLNFFLRSDSCDVMHSAFYVEEKYNFISAALGVFS